VHTNSLYIYFNFCTCFGQLCANHQENLLYLWDTGVFQSVWAYRVLVGKPEEKRPLGRPRCRWVDNIRVDLQEVEYGYVDWIGVAQDRDRWRTFVSAAMNLRIP